MASWMVQCEKCRVLFSHTMISAQSLADYLLPQKPEFPVDGAELKCPNCAHVALYQRSELTYRA